MPPPRLNATERDVLALLLVGKRQQTIAVTLSLSRHTVGHAVQRLVAAHGAEDVAAMLATLHEADKVVLRARYATLVGEQINARPNRRSGQDRRQPE